MSLFAGCYFEKPKNLNFVLPNQPNVKQVSNCDDAINAADDLAIEEPFPEMIFIYTCLSINYPQVHKSSSNLKIET